MTFAAAAALAGILFAEHLHPPLLLLGVLLIPLIVPWPKEWRPFGWLLFAALLFAALHRSAALPGERLAAVLAQAPSQSLPIRFSGSVREWVPGGGFRFHLTGLSQGATTMRADSLVLLQVPSRRIQPGDRLSGYGRLSALPSARNPGERSFDRSSRARIDVASFQQLRVEGRSFRRRAECVASGCREWIAQAITKGLCPESEPAGLIQAMVLGARDEASPASEEAFRKSGAMHLFCVSGLHVAIFASVIWALLRPFPVSRLHTVLIIAGAASFYAFITGLPPSAVRAALMLSVVLLGFALRREARLLNSLGLAALLIFIADTSQLFDIGFQLSFAVMTAIALLCPSFNRLFGMFTSPDPFIPRSLVSRDHRRLENIGRYFTGLAGVSLAAWIGSLPLTLWYFGLLTPFSVLANCALVPVAWLVMAGATVSLTLSLFHIPWLPACVNQLNAAGAAFLQGLAAFFAHIPGAAIELTPLSQSLFHPLQANPSLIVFDLQSSCAPQAILLPRQPGQPQPPVWLIDTGDFSGYAQTVRPWLRRLHVRELEGLFLTHGDSQHVEAAPACLEDFAVRRLIFNPLDGRSPVWNLLQDQPLSSRQIRMELGTGSHLELARDVTLQVVFPPHAYPDQSMADDECLVLLIEWHGWRLLSLADSGFATEKWLLEHQPGLRCDVVIRSRHRQDASDLPELLRQLRPRCLISTNCSFPAPERIPDSLQAQLASLDIALFDQALTGAVTLYPAPDRLTIRPFCGEEPLVLERDRSPVSAK